MVSRKLIIVYCRLPFLLVISCTNQFIERYVKICTPLLGDRCPLEMRNRSHDHEWGVAQPLERRYYALAALAALPPNWDYEDGPW